MKRRDFIKNSLLVGAGALTIASAAKADTDKPADSASILNYHPGMAYRPHGTTGAMVSALGFGMLRLPRLADGKTVDEAKSIELLRHAIDHGVNYVDTAWIYLGGQSEAATGKALANGYRDRVYLTSKSPWWVMERPEDFEKCFDESRKRLNTDVIDFYHLHMLMHRGWNEKAIPFKLVDKMNDLKAKGKIRFAGFSYHDGLPLFKKIVDANPEWGFCLVQHNILDRDYEAGVGGLDYAAAHGMGVSIMEPLRNGDLVNPPRDVMAIYGSAPIKRSPVEWAFDYLWNKPEVSVVVSGMNSMQNVNDNLEYASRSKVGMLTPRELEILGAAARKYLSYPGASACVGCYQCIPCPQNVAIGYLLHRVYNQYLVNNDRERLRMLTSPTGAMSPVQRGAGPEACNGCGECVAKCPQGLDIPAELRRMAAIMKG